MHRTMLSEDIGITGPRMSPWRDLRGWFSVCHVAALVFVLVTFGLQSRAQVPRQEVIGYYPSWIWRGGTHVMTPDLIPYDRLSMINYAFFFPRPDGTITGRDSTGDDLLLKGARDSSTGQRQESSSLIALAHRNRVKVLLSIGGWEDSGNFPSAASDSASRQRFAHSCVNTIREFGFDGIDIDWEYPGYVEHNGTPADGKNFILLLQSLRDSLDAHGKAGEHHYLLTAALPAGPEHVARIPLQGIAPFLDLMNIMTYDFNGSWEPNAGHNSPLFPPEGGDSSRSVDSAFRLYHAFYGIPSQKIGLGIPFYGHTFTKCSAIGGPQAGSDTSHFAAWGARYIDIAGAMNHFERHWDTLAQVPYLVSKEWNMLVSYDDQASVRAKADYAVEKGVGGIIIWEITGDYMPDGSHPLLDAVHTGLRKPSPIHH